MTTPHLEARLLAECCQYITALREANRVETVTDLLADTSYVYLSRRQRLALAWRLLLTCFR